MITGCLIYCKIDGCVCGCERDVYGAWWPLKLNKILSSLQRPVIPPFGTAFCVKRNVPKWVLKYSDSAEMLGNEILRRKAPVFTYALLCICEPRQRSRYSNSLRAGRSGARISVGTIFSAPVQTGPGGPPSLLYNGCRVFLPGVKQPGRGVYHPPYLAPKVKKE